MKIIKVIALSFILFSCSNQKKEMTYKEYTSVDSSFVVEIPSNVIQGKCIADFMSFENEQAHLIISVQHIYEESINEYIRNKDITNNTFEYALFQSSDTTSFYKITRGNNMWSAYDLYMLKKVEGKNYIIEASSDVFGQLEMVKMIKHIYSSMKPNQVVESEETTIKDSQMRHLERMYTSKYYSISYPKKWKVIEQLDAMTDVYIGSEEINFGFTIVRFETDYSLEEANIEGNKNARQAGIKIIHDKQIIIDGIKGYRAIHELEIYGEKVKHISYTFKKGDILYNVKFGSVTKQIQETLAEDIMMSFRFK